MSDNPHRETGKVVDFPQESLEAYMERHSSTCMTTPCRRCEMITRIDQQHKALFLLCPGDTEQDRLIAAASVVGGRLLLNILKPKKDPI